MEKPENPFKKRCAGCVYWRTAGTRSYTGPGLRCCHYLLDTGRSRLKLCGWGRCSVRRERRR